MGSQLVLIRRFIIKVIWLHIETTFSQEFDDWYNKINQTEKGKELLDIEGISRRCLDVGGMSHSYFTKKFIDETIDSNANAGEGISPNNYGSEITKGVQKLEGFYLLHRYASRRFGLEKANKLLNSIIKGDIYFHDSSGVGIQEVYSYFRDTTVLISVDKNCKLISLGRLYEMFESSSRKEEEYEYIDTKDYLFDTIYTSNRKGKTSCYDKLDLNFSKTKKDIRIWTGKEWKDITKIIKHKRHNNLLCLNTGDGRITVVTEDHPVVLSNGETKTAKDIQIGEKLMTSNDPIPYEPTRSIDTKVTYIMGMMAGDGFIQAERIAISQLNGKILDHIKSIFSELGYQNFKQYNDRASRIYISNAKLGRSMVNYFNADGNSYKKSVPFDIVSWDKDSIASYVAGLFDAEGSISGSSKQYTFRVMNMGLAVQFSEILKILGVEFLSVNGRDQRKSINGYQASTNIIYIVSFYPTEESMDLLRKYSIKMKNEVYYKKDSRMRNPTDNSIKRIVKIESGLDIFDYVYDITVDGELFYSQGLIQHNCVGVSTQPIMTEGRPYGPLHSVPPKRADSFMAQTIEFTMDLSQRFAGAVALGDLFVNYAWYAKKENLPDKQILNDFQKYVHVTNNTFRVGSQSPFTNLSLFDKKNLEKVFEHYKYPDGSSVDFDYIMHIQKIFATWFAKGDPVSGFPYRFPIVTVNIACDENKDILDKEFLDFISTTNLEKCCFNIYVNSGEKIASCCRLINDMRKFKSDTFGNGGMNLGSHRVVTINPPGLALKSGGNKEKFFEKLQISLENARDLLQVHREDIITRRIKAGFLDFFNPLYWLTLDRFFSTIGIIGIYEMNKLMGYDITSEEGIQFTSDVLNYIEDFAKKTSEETGHCFNVEEIPGESVSSKLCQKDKVVFGIENVPFELYSNQYIPLIESVPLPERIITTGKFMDILSGGGILHLNVSEKIKDPSIMKHLIEYSVKNGASHFAVNYGFGTCEKGHTTICGNVSKCPECGSKMVDYVTRVVGYFSHVSNWQKTRREYEFPKRVFS